MTLQGNVEDLGVAELLYMIGISRRSGLLRLEDRRGEHRILFRGGDIVAVLDRQAPGTLADLLVQKQLIDPTHLAVLERQARQQGRPLRELLEGEGLLGPGVVAGHLRREVERLVNGVLQLNEGTFTFELLEDEETAHGSFGGLVLREGIAPARLPAVAEGSRGGTLRGLSGGLSLPKSEAGRKVELLVGESDISLPALPSAASHAGASLADVTEESPHPLALLALGWTSLGRALQARLETAGFVVQRPHSLSDAVEQVELARRRGRSVQLVADATLSALPGHELLARLKLVDRTVGAILLLDPKATPAQRANQRRRAERLGGTHVTLLPADEPAQAVEALAAELCDLVQGVASRGPSTIPALHAPLGTTPDEPPEMLAGPLEAQRALCELGLEQQDRRLATTLRDLVPSLDAAELALALLPVAGDYAPRCLLLVPVGEELRVFGALGPESAHAAFVDRARRLRLPRSGGHLVPSVMRAGRGRRAVVGELDPTLLETLGRPAPRELAALPLVAAGQAVAALVLDDGGSARLPELSSLERFLSGTAATLGQALRASLRRAESRRLLAAR